MLPALHFMIPPLDCDPPHQIGYPDKVAALQDAFAASGWDVSHPRLVGYPLGGRIQLLSGSHRWAASIGVLDAIPVSVVALRDVEEAWGSPEAWAEVMASGNVA